MVKISAKDQSKTRKRKIWHDEILHVFQSKGWSRDGFHTMLQQVMQEGSVYRHQLFAMFDPHRSN